MATITSRPAVSTGHAETIALHPGDARIQTEDGGLIGYDRLLLATGARPRRLDVPAELVATACP